jgi:hypothetical protein
MDSCSRTTRSSTRSPHHEYTDDARTWARRSPRWCARSAASYPDALALLRLQSARASDAHVNVNRIGGRKAFINVLLSAAARSHVPSRSATRCNGMPRHQSSLLCLVLKARYIDRLIARLFLYL